MSNAPRKRAGTPPPPPPPPPGHSPGRSPAGATSGRGAPARQPSRTAWIVGAIIVAVVVIAGVIAIVSASSDDEKGTPSNLPQNQPVTVTGAALADLPDSGDDLAIGVVAPTLTGSSFDGTPVVVEPGTPTLLLFVAHWCPHCRREVPLLVKWEQDGGVPAGVDVVGISTSVESDQANYPPSSWLSDEKFPWPVLADDADSSAASAYGLTAFPYFVLLDADGKVVMRDTGEIPPEELATKIRAALA